MPVLGVESMMARQSTDARAAAERRDRLREGRGVRPGGTPADLAEAEVEEAMVLASTWSNVQFRAMTSLLASAGIVLLTAFLWVFGSDAIATGGLKSAAGARMFAVLLALGGLWVVLCGGGVLRDTGTLRRWGGSAPMLAVPSGWIAVAVGGITAAACVVRALI